jgi:hypothetical protein
MERRQFIQMLAGGSVAPLVPTRSWAQILATHRDIALECLGNVPGVRILDGRTRNGSVGMVEKICIKSRTGTRWTVFQNGDGTVGLQCRGNIDWPRWLDGRTADGTVGPAPNRNPPFSGTRWEVMEVGPDQINLRCLGTTEGSRMLDGRTQNGSVGLAPSTNAPFTGTRWRVKSYPVCIDEPCGECL